jgi:hypothetical protein
MSDLTIFETVNKQKTVKSRSNLLILLINFAEQYVAGHEINCLVDVVVY